MKSTLLVLLVLVALCHSKTIPWSKKQPAMVRKTAPETIPWVKKQPAIVRKTATETIPWFEKQPALVRKTAPETIPWFEKQPAMVHKTVSESEPWLTKQPAIMLDKEEQDDIQCPDQISSCPASTTCCLLKDGFYGCCPSENAVCCDDEKHCCPEGYKCNPATYECLKENWHFEALLHFPAKKSKYVQCSGSAASCPVGSTCCMMGNNQYGCCPTPNAECCADGKHCCAEGYICNKKSKKCIRTGILRLAQRTDPLQKKAKSKREPFCKLEDGEAMVEGGPLGKVCGRWSQCPRQYTCCRNTRGGWSCCPLPNAECCPDRIHCCRENFICNATTNECMPPEEHHQQLKFTSVSVGDDTPSSIVCPGGGQSCPSGTTCCVTSSGQYGCCPFPDAVCCSDKEHCCPKGFKCNVAGGTCTKSDDEIDFLVVEEPVTAKDVVCPDGASKCATGTTCCKTTSGQYACCPIPDAVCCNDGSHCCPSGYTCNVGAGTCTKSDNEIVFLVVEEPVTAKDVVCPDGASKCATGTTCCKTTSGQYACCPIPDAVCCNDGSHCCPSGYTCNVGAGTCTKSYDQTTALTLQDNVGDNEDCGGGYTCPDGTTCCQMSSGEWGCCPYPNAVCCSDGQHCCPNGYRCDLSSESCVMSNGEKFLAFSEIIAASANIVCPDQSQCAEGNTCCEMTAGKYGCCPQPNAVCCSDGQHCCPSGYTCDVSAGTCIQSATRQALDSGYDVNAVTCDDMTQCPDKNTCCKMPTGDWGCCPLPEAVCCNDGLHCCANGYVCSPDSSTCQKSNQPESVITSTELTGQNKVGGIICPDGQKQCTDYDTCCLLKSGEYGCCPYPHAVCCDDQEHCCPHGYTCNEALGICTLFDESPLYAVDVTSPNHICPDNTSFCPIATTCCNNKDGGPMLCCADYDYECCDSQGCCPKRNQVASLAIEYAVNNVVCPDGTSQCPAGNTCCKMTSGQYGCCPLPDAVCCNDGSHCCPKGSKCNPSAGTCTKLEDRVSLETLGAVMTDVICPDGLTQCPVEDTCCKLNTGDYGCCPYADGVCCSDGIHCCPNGYTCDIWSGTCKKQMTTMTRSYGDEDQLINSVTCPDGTSICRDGDTCCSIGNGLWACCPLLNAVCCGDQTHCCPEGYMCDVSGGYCSKSSSFVTMETSSKVVQCPDGQSSCPDGNTCCKLSSGQWGCCPYPKAVCCSDGAHCCPEGYTCNTGAGTCSKSDGDQIFSLVVEVIAPNVICPDGASQCPDGSTCCKLSSGQWGCCPYPKAVCCSDGAHCCPQGYTCNTGAGTCSKSDSDQIFSLVVEEIAPNVVCPDGASQCPDGSTCCKLSSGQWGCCPYPKAVCCSDGAHCCPQGYTCNTGAGTCSKSDSDQIFSLVVEEIAPNVICPDGASQCPDGSTCCKLSSGQWGCCPYPKAVCCSDGAHCCPEGYTCNTGAGTCSKSDGDQIFSLVVEEIAPNVICPDGASQCPDGSTCCKLSSGQWGCCPYPKAVCCSDGAHCCPEGYTCNTGAGTCSKSDGDQIFSLVVEEIAPNVICPDGASQCPDGSTCCKLSSGQWGCCPYPKAVCCSDGAHCCPQGYTCNTGAGTCSKSDGDQIFSLEIEAIAPNVVCPDGQSCPDGSTCCELASGAYGCCPLPNAECCSDKLHCCPQDYTCDLSAGTCSKSHDQSNDQLAEELKAPVVCPDCSSGETCCKLASGEYGCCPGQNALIVEGAVGGNVVCPGGQFTCPTDNTCCKLPTGSYGCCPLPKAVCCSDGLHCCPEGHKCDVKSAKCESKVDVIPYLRKIPAKPISSESNVDFVQIKNIN